MASVAAPNVFIIDDSALVRQVLTETLRSKNINVIGTAPDPIFARQKMEKNWPDVILLDMEMPRMDGLTFLKQLMAERPTPVIVCSTLTDKGAQLSVDAMSAGAVSVLTKSSVGVRDGLRELKDSLVRAIREASQARPARKQTARSIAAPADTPQVNQALSYRTTDRVVAIGTSTGGTQALEAVLSALPPDSPGILAVQHMPEKFTAAFAARLNNLCRIEVREASDGDRVHAGLALLAPGGKHMELVRSGAQYRVRIFDGPHVTRHKPSVDVLFRSVAQSAGQNATGIIMTGMGDDGARGLKAMKDKGAATVAQDEASCVVYGMPKEAVKLGAVDIVAPLKNLPELIMKRPARREEPVRPSRAV
ncbi:protein-glutamate methylesterase/protein-glutamine glutaminase [Marinobacter salsuginis]|uniref:protein-glutamate methylesterase/protein-glutamine glutaminase n=1 Tax=Marinobacter salsuginis TaxID=418719 RepID=UPI00273EC721|nr:chemotaxis response regulator protein-glutamate methylesterase [Marinobacter salsuginis]